MCLFAKIGGHDAVNDVKSAIAAGLQACLVKTAKCQPADELYLPVGTAVLESIAELLSD